jgi:hypothetical protein
VVLRRAGAPKGSETNAQRLFRIYGRWEATPIAVCCVFMLGVAGYRFYSMAHEPDTQWTRQKNEHEWVSRLEKKAAEKTDRS